MRRFLLTLAAMAALAGPMPRSAVRSLRAAETVDCTDYCAERAAEHCDRIDSWKCTWYILGCLGGCNIAQL